MIGRRVTIILKQDPWPTYTGIIHGLNENGLYLEQGTRLGLNFFAWSQIATINLLEQ